MSHARTLPLDQALCADTGFASEEGWVEPSEAPYVALLIDGARARVLSRGWSRSSAGERRLGLRAFSGRTSIEAACELAKARAEEIGVDLPLPWVRRRSPSGPPLRRRRWGLPVRLALAHASR